MSERVISKSALLKSYRKKTTPEVLKEFGISKGTLYTMLKKWGEPTNKEPGNVTPVEWVD